MKIEIIQIKLKQARKEMLNPDAPSLMQYWLGYVRAFEWALENKKNEKR